MATAILYRASNLVAMDYPFEASLVSALQFADEACVVVGRSEDATNDLLYSLQEEHGKDRVKIRHETIVFDQGWQERCWNWAAEMTGADWLMYLDADEVIHEKDTPALAELLKYDQLNLINFPYIHFYGTGTWHISKNAKWPTRNTRIGRRNAGYRMLNWARHDGSGCACQMVVSNGNGHVTSAHIYEGPEIYKTSIPIMHYGWARDAIALAISQTKHHAWYKNDTRLFDGHLPDVEPWNFNMKAMYTDGKIEWFNGGHPESIQGWLDAHENEWDAIDDSVFGERTREY